MTYSHLRGRRVTRRAGVEVTQPDPLGTPERDKHHRFPVESSSHGVWLYYRFCLSSHEVEELCRAVLLGLDYGVGHPQERVRSYTDLDRRINKGIKSPCGGKTLCLSHTNWLSLGAREVHADY